MPSSLAHLTAAEQVQLRQLANQLHLHFKPVLLYCLACHYTQQLQRQWLQHPHRRQQQQLQVSLLLIMADDDPITEAHLPLLAERLQLPQRRFWILVHRHSYFLQQLQAGQPFFFRVHRSALLLLGHPPALQPCQAGALPSVASQLIAGQVRALLAAATGHGREFRTHCQQSPAAVALPAVRRWLGTVLQAWLLQVLGYEAAQLPLASLLALSQMPGLLPAVPFPNHQPEEKYLWRLLTAEGDSESVLPEALEIIGRRTDQLQQSLAGRVAAALPQLV